MVRRCRPNPRLMTCTCWMCGSNLGTDILGSGESALQEVLATDSVKVHELMYISLPTCPTATVKDLQLRYPAAALGAETLRRKRSQLQCTCIEPLDLFFTGQIMTHGLLNTPQQLPRRCAHRSTHADTAEHLASTWQCYRLPAQVQKDQLSIG